LDAQWGYLEESKEFGLGKQKPGDSTGRRPFVEAENVFANSAQKGTSLRGEGKRRINDPENGATEIMPGGKKSQG